MDAGTLEPPTVFQTWGYLKNLGTPPTDINGAWVKDTIGHVLQLFRSTGHIEWMVTLESNPQEMSIDHEQITQDSNYIRL